MLKNDVMFNHYQINPTEGITINPSRLVTAFKEGMETLGVWMDRSRKRRQLLQMNQYALKDIGVTPSDVSREASNWFWQA